jgi:hypothetical protein
MTGDDCNIGDKEGIRSAVNFKMTDDSCIRQSDRLSFWPGYKATDGGDYCFVYYKDGNCVTIDGARRIHTNWYEEVDCETTMVWNHTSFHFEKAKKVGNASSGIKIAAYSVGNLSNQGLLCSRWFEKHGRMGGGGARLSICHVPMKLA